MFKSRLEIEMAVILPHLMHLSLDVGQKVTLIYKLQYKMSREKLTYIF